MKDEADLKSGISNLRSQIQPSSVFAHIVILICCVLPLAWLAWQILSDPRVLIESWPDTYRLSLLGRTLLYNGAVAVIAVLLGLPVGLALGRGHGRATRILWIALPVSLLLPSLTYAYGWSQFFRLIDAHPRPGGGFDVLRCVWSLATWLWPIPAAAVGSSLRRLDAQLQLQALLDGVLWRMTFRELAASLAAAGAICCVLAMQEFAVYEPTGISVIATEVRMVFETGAFSSADNPITAPMGALGAGGLSDQRSRAAGAVAVSIPLLLVIALLAVPVLYTARHLAGTEEIDAGPWPRALDVPRGVTIAALLIVLVAVLVPAAALVMSLYVWRSPLAVWDELSPQLIGSISVSALAGAVGLILAVCTTAGRVPRPVLLIALVTFLVGGQLMAIAQIRLYNRPGLSWVYNGPLIVVMADIGRFGWIALLAGLATWSPRWRSLRDIASVDGAGAMRTASSVVLPLAWPILLAAGVLVMVLALTEVPATLLILPQRPPMLTPMLMTWVHMLRYDAMIEASLLLMAMVTVLGVAVAGLLALFAGTRRWKIGSPPKVSVAALLAGALTILSTGCGGSGQPDAIWCETGNGPAQVIYPRAIAYRPQDDTFFIIDRSAHVQQLDRRGQCLNEWWMPEWKTGKPVGVSVGPDGNIYIPDTHYHRIMVYSPQGELLRKWGTFGKGPGQFIFPTDIAFDARGNLFVTEYGDSDTDRIQVFSRDGSFLYTFGRFGKGDGEFIRPQSILIHDDLVYVTDACNHRIAIFKTDGTFVRNLGSTGSDPGQFRYPYGLDMDGDGDLIVCEFGNNRVQKIDRRTGAGKALWGGGGHDPGQLAYPWGVAVDRDDRIVAVDAGNNRLQVFEF